MIDSINMIFFSKRPAVAPVVPELKSEDDTSNFSTIDDPDSVNEGFELTKVFIIRFFTLHESL